MQTGLQILNNMCGYNTPIPDAPVTRNHRLGVYSSGFKRTEKDEERLAQQKARPVKDPKILKDSEKIILKIVNKGEGLTGVEVSKKTRWTANHCSMILTSLYRRGLITRTKQKDAGTRWFVYHARKV